MKKTVDEGNVANGQSPISWADFLVLAARLAVKKEWRNQKVNQGTHSFSLFSHREKRHLLKKVHRSYQRFTDPIGQFGLEELIPTHQDLLIAFLK